MSAKRINDAVTANRAVIHQNDDGEWTVYIPPVLPEDRDGEDLVSPAGDSCYVTFGEAAEFMAKTLSEPKRKAAMDGLKPARRRTVADLIEAAQVVARDDRHWSVVDVADRAESGSSLASMVLTHFGAEEDECPGDCKECEEHHTNTGYDELAGRDEDG